jgi:hypothetical protein
MTDIFEEVDEALKKEKIQRIWEDYKTTIIACIGILIVGTGAGSAYHGWNNNRNSAETAKLINALDETNPDQALIAAVEKTRANHKAIGLLNAASVLKEDGKTEEAKKIYADLIETKSAPRELRDLARILYSQSNGDKALDYLRPLLANDKSPWQWHAKIEAATREADQGNYDSALSYLEGFEEQTNLPATLKQRGEALRHVYTIRNKKNNESNQPS